jgi:hypothetical protein
VEIATQQPKKRPLEGGRRIREINFLPRLLRGLGPRKKS